MNRRVFLATAIAGVAGAQQVSEPPPAVRALKPMAEGAPPSTDAEHAGRVEKARRLMRDNRLDAIYLENGTSMYYFTGKRQGGQAWILPGKGEPGWLQAPAGKGGVGRACMWRGSGEPVWLEADAAKAAGALKDLKIATGRVGLEEQVRFATFDGLRKAAGQIECVSAMPVTAGCRMIKSPAELVLMKPANDIDRKS